MSLTKGNLKRIADTFYSYEQFYLDLKNNNWKITKTRAAKEPWMVEWALECFEREEQYEKCVDLKQILLSNEIQKNPAYIRYLDYIKQQANA